MFLGFSGFVVIGTLEKAKTFEEAHDDYAYGLNKNKIFSDANTVSAKEKRGVSSFMQHLPEDQNKHKKYLINALKNPEQFVKHSKMNISVEQAKKLFKEKEVNEEYLNNFVEELLKETVTDHEFEDIEFLPDATKFSVATSNVEIRQIVCCGCPMAVAVAKYPIKEKEQIGFSYGAQYWQTCYRYPELFDKNGFILDRTLYKRKKLCVNFIDPTKKYVGLPMEDEAENFVKDIVRNKPIAAVISEKEEILLSVYDLRDKLVEANAVDKTRFGEIESPSLALTLKKKFHDNKTDSKPNFKPTKPDLSEVSVKTYYQNPTKSIRSTDKLDALDACTVDIVCKAPNEKKLSELTDFFKPIANRIKKFSETNELVITSTNVIDPKDESFKKFFAEL